MINGPQPVPGQPPRIWPNDPYQGGSATTMPMQPPPPSMFFNPDGSPMFTGGGKDSTGMPLISDGPGNRGSGQPINQPMNPNQGHVTPFAGPGWDYNYDPTTGRGTQTDASGKTTNYNYPASQLPQGSLQSLGGGQLNQSGMGRRAPIYQLGNRAMPSKQQAMLKALIAQMMGR